MAALEEFVVILKAATGEFTGRMAEAGGEMEALGGRGERTFAKLASVGKAALLGIGVAAIAVGYESVKLADKYESAHARLVSALDNTNTSWDAQAAAIKRVETSGASLGFNMTDIEGALAQMTTGLGSSSKAVGALGVVEDLAAAKGIPLAQAALLVTKGMEGQIRPLKQLGIDLPVAAGGALKTKTAFEALVTAQDKLKLVTEQIADHQLKGKAAMTAYANASDAVAAKQQKLNEVSHAGSDILAALGQKLAGQAAAQADTFGGKLKALRAELDNIGTRIGLWLIPKLQAMATALLDTITWMQKHKDIAAALAIVIGGALVAAITAYVIQAAIAIAETLALAAPFLLVAAAIGATVTALVLLYVHWNQVVSFMKDHKALTAVILVLNPIILLLVSIVAAVKFLQANWSTIWPVIASTAQTAGTVIAAVFDGIESTIASVVNVFQHFPERVKDALGQVVAFIAQLPGRIVVALGTLSLFLLNVFKNAFLALAKNLPKFFEQVAEWFIALPIILIAYIAKFSLLFDQWMANAFISLVQALPGFALGVLSFFVGLPNKIINAVASLAPLLLRVGFNALVGFLNGAVSFFGNVLGFFESMPGRIAGAIGDLSGLLFNIGSSILHGLVNGAQSAIGAVHDFFSGIASKITSWKGPPAYDATILVGNGRLIMQGLQAGLAAGMSGVKEQLQGFSADLPRSFNVNAHQSLNTTIGASSAHTAAPIYVVVNVDDSGRASVKALQNYNRTHGPAPIKVTAG